MQRLAIERRLAATEWAHNRQDRAAPRDLISALRQAQLAVGRDLGQRQDHTAADRLAGAEDRQAAAVDRRASSRDRRLAALDRLEAGLDRQVTAGQRTRRRLAAD
jgi:hypothetical protein